MGRPRILYVLNNHPRTSPGGAEIYSYELYHSVRDGGKFEPTFVAKMGPPPTIPTTICSTPSTSSSTG
jgi:hypothetical protein